MTKTTLATLVLSLFVLTLSEAHAERSFQVHAEQNVKAPPAGVGSKLSGVKSPAPSVTPPPQKAEAEDTTITSTFTGGLEASITDNIIK